MPTVHFLNVGKGDCSIIQHGSGRVSVIDICNGKSMRQRTLATVLAEAASGAGSRTYSPESGIGSCWMKDSPTDPVAYLKGLGISSVFRFILTHPDMDHLDGFKALCDDVEILNFWDSGVRKEKPDFENSPYSEADWDCYVAVRDRRYSGITVVSPRSKSRFQFANAGDPEDRGDCLDVLAPSTSLVKVANASGDPNDSSFVLVYRTSGGKIVFPGDAHDDTGEHVVSEHADKVADCSVLIAPHHGRASGRSYDFLDALRPKLTLFGCAPSKDLAYDAWNNRDLLHITNNQAGNVTLDAVTSGIDVYVENRAFAETFDAFDAATPHHNCFYIGQVPKP